MHARALAGAQQDTYMQHSHISCSVAFFAPAMSSLISAVAWVRRGVAAQHPRKYILDDPELERVSALARIELEDARVELERAHIAAQSMGKGDETDDNDEADWVESVI